MQILMAPHFQMFVAIKCLMKFELHLFFTEFKYIYVFPQYNTVNKREETAKSYSFIDPEDYRATALINKVSKIHQHIHDYPKEVISVLLLLTKTQLIMILPNYSNLPNQRWVAFQLGIM